MYSTRKARKRPGTACSSRGVAADAEAAGDAEAAEGVAGDVAALSVAHTGVGLAVCRGVHAASVKPDHIRSVDKCRFVLAGLD